MIGGYSSRIRTPGAVFLPLRAAAHRGSRSRQEGRWGRGAFLSLTAAYNQAGTVEDAYAVFGVVRELRGCPAG